MLSYRATQPVPDIVIQTASGWLHAYRRAHDTRPWQRAATCWTQADMSLHRLTNATAVHCLATDHDPSPATTYRHLTHCHHRRRQPRPDPGRRPDRPAAHRRPVTLDPHHIGDIGTTALAIATITRGR